MCSSSVSAAMRVSTVSSSRAIPRALATSRVSSSRTHVSATPGMLSMSPALGDLSNAIGVPGIWSMPRRRPNRAVARTTACGESSQNNYYYGIIGIYMLCLPLMVLILYKINESIKPSVFSILMSLIIFVTFIEGSTFFLQTIFQLINGNPLTFITNVLGPTLLLNITLFVLLIYPLKRLFRIE